MNFSLNLKKKPKKSFKRNKHFESSDEEEDDIVKEFGSNNSNNDVFYFYKDKKIYINESLELSSQLEKNGINFALNGNFAKAISHFKTSIELVDFFLQNNNNISNIILNSEEDEMDVDVDYDINCINERLAKILEMKAQIELDIGNTFTAIKNAERACECFPTWKESYLTLGK
eukprot:TRINITY_DN103_c1_g1_i2.p1 TRINITY_DN103_c1_g1~~TRINITY_DN103_c1_g1_i2.p1  ORF type:complete len:173 (+),score=50.13 TRINITY_DN103_c1_g1_i2:159-677(+)